MLSTNQKREAVAQMRSHCDLSMAKYETGVGEYESLSARSVLYELGYDEGEADEVLTFVAERGFNYCVDPIIPNPNTGERPPRHACYWGADQLLSRLDFIS